MFSPWAIPNDPRALPHPPTRPVQLALTVPQAKELRRLLDDALAPGTEPSYERARLAYCRDHLAAAMRGHDRQLGRVRR
jgi:hypothetical protein